MGDHRIGSHIDEVLAIVARALQGSEFSDVGTPVEVKKLERGEAGQRGQVVAELLAAGEVEQFEGGEAGQRG
jgi:hypothetical protein